MLDLADFIRGGLALLYLTAAIRAGRCVYKKVMRRWQERYIMHLITWVATGWSIYWMYGLAKFFDSPVSTSHVLLTALGRMWHVPTAVSLMLIQYLLLPRRRT